MALNDKINNAAEDLGGKAKEAAGSVTGDDRLRDEGKGDQLEAGVKKAAEDVKDAARTVADKVKNAFKR
ncbi:CsbD family protein [Nocardia transvalensis]|uniref:CsbD family protein n=1 Tax=Nocardia transvalensis TaxID=37333 RepID=UPI001894908C|nr:CsbD family protein [Nocardia transvalensis]MBF6326919.1 CsbD family protein [Nocardia transvalensis]